MRVATDPADAATSALAELKQAVNQSQLVVNTQKLQHKAKKQAMLGFRCGCRCG